MQRPNRDVAQKLTTALSLLQQGRRSQAGQIYRDILDEQPRNGDALHFLGIIAYQERDLANAETLLRRAIDVSGNNPAYICNLGNVLAEQGRTDEAVTSYRRALRLAPDFPEALNSLGVALRACGRPGEAADCYRRALTLSPQFVEAYKNLGNALLDEGKADDAAAAFARAAALKPKSAESHIDLAVALHRAQRLEEALAALDKALSVSPRNAQAAYIRGNVLRDLGRRDAAVESYRRAIEVDPDIAEAHNNLSRLLLDRDDVVGAIASLRDAVRRKPDYAEAHQHLGFAYFLSGDFAGGWREYEWRWRTSGLQGRWRNFPQPIWRGEPLDGGKLLVWGEQGVGDEIIYASMIPDLLEREIGLVLECDARLAPLFRRSFPKATVVGRSTPQAAATAEPAIHAHIPIASLGQLLRPDLASFPRRRSYLRADPSRTGEYRQRLDGAGRTIVGVSWRSTNAAYGASKSMALTDLAPILTRPDCLFVDLQYGDTAAERAAAAHAGIALAHLDDLDLFHDLEGVAALVAACDHVVTVSNTTAHFAGALGKPASVMLPFGGGCLWYWLRDRSDSPWYGTMTLYRQRGPGDWSEVVNAVQAGVASMASA